MPNYYSQPLSQIVQRRLQRTQSRGSLIDWPPQNLLRRRPPTRGRYRVRQPLVTSRMPRLPSGGFPTLPTLGKGVPEIRGVAKPRFPFLRGI